MREIEIKASVKDTKRLLESLEAHGIKLGKAIKQHDIVFSQPGAKDNEPDANWLRVRIENDEKVMFTLKRPVTGELDSIEHEVTVNNAEELLSIIKLLGYEKFSDLTKVRQKAKHENVEICYDVLPDLGTYIEAERLCPDDADFESVASELWDLFTQLGLSKDNEETHGYDVLQRRKDGITSS